MNKISKMAAVVIAALCVSQSAHAQIGQYNKVFPASAIPLDLTSASTTTAISLKNYHRVDFFIQCGTLGTDAVGVSTVTVAQATSVSFATQKALTPSTYWMNGALGDVYTNQNATAVTITSADDNKTYVISVRADELDGANAYDCIQLKFTDYGTNTANAAVTAVLSGPRFAGDEASMPSALGN